MTPFVGRSIGYKSIVANSNSSIGFKDIKFWKWNISFAMEFK